MPNNNEKKYASLSTLQAFLANLKTTFTAFGHKHTVSDLTDYVVDSELNPNSTNPVQNSVLNAEFDEIAVSMKALESALDGKSDSGHNHNGWYYLRDEVDSLLEDKANKGHNHDGWYYLRDEVDQMLSTKSDSTHHHDSAYDTKGAAAESLDSAKSYTDSKTANLASTSAVDTKISTHNTSTSAHNDIRDLISGLTTRLNTLANSDDTTLDQMSEVVEYIKNNKSLIDGITTSKINVADIINNLTTNVTNKPLSAAQGVVIKGLIDALETVVDGKADSVHDHNNATSTSAGFMSTEMVDKLNGIENGANKTIVDSNLSSASTNPIANKAVAETFSEFSDYVTNNFLHNNRITDNLTSSASNYALSAKQGKVLKSYVDNLQAEVDSKADASHVHSFNDLQDRPFGDETVTEEILMSNKSVSMYGDGWYRITPVVELVAGATYKVTFNGVTYESVAWVSPSTNTICIGNGEIYGGEDYGNWSAPFAFEYGNGMFSLYSNDFGDATFSIVKVVEDVTKLDEIFIPDTIARASDFNWTQIYDSGEITEAINAFANINIQGYKKLMVAVKCVNDGTNSPSKHGGVTFTSTNGVNYQFNLWSTLFTNAAYTSGAMATFEISDGWLICPNAIRILKSSNFLGTEGGVADNLNNTGGGIMKCTNTLSTMMISNTDNDSNYYFLAGSRVMVWGCRA